MIEEWRDVSGYEGVYQVSNLGKVRSLDRYVKCRNGNLRLIKGRIMSAQLRNTHEDSNPYYRVLLKDASRNLVKNFWVHRLVAQAFIPNTNGLPCVNHKDENRLNNTVDNLEWCTYSYNTNYGSCIERSVQTKRDTGKYIVSEATRHKLSTASKGRKHSDATRLKMSNSAKLAWIKKKYKKEE